MLQRMEFLILSRKKHYWWRNGLYWDAAPFPDDNGGKQTCPLQGRKHRAANKQLLFFGILTPSKERFFSLLRKVVCLPRIYCSRPQETSSCWVGAWYAAFRSRVIGWQWLEEFWDGLAMIWRSGNDMEIRWHWSLPKRITALNQIKTRQGGNTSQPKVIELARHCQGWSVWQSTTGHFDSQG